MKNNLKLITTLLVASTLLISCSKDDTRSSKNYLKVGGTEYPLSDVYMRRLGTNTTDESYVTDLTLLTGYLKMDGWLTGKVNIIGFVMHTTTDKAIDSRVFVYNNYSQAGTFYGEYTMDVDIKNSTHGGHFSFY